MVNKKFDAIEYTFLIFERDSDFRPIFLFTLFRSMNLGAVCMYAEFLKHWQEFNQHIQDLSKQGIFILSYLHFFALFAPLRFSLPSN